MGQITVFPGLERRRRWSDEDRLQILNEAFAPAPTSRMSQMSHGGVMYRRPWSTHGGGSCSMLTLSKSRTIWQLSVSPRP